MIDEDRPTFAPPDADGAQALDEGGDYVFRFRLQQGAADADGYDDPLLELIRGQLADLLRAVTLTHRGKRVQVDGFRLLRDPDTQYDLFPGRQSAVSEDARRDSDD